MGKGTQNDKDPNLGCQGRGDRLTWHLSSFLVFRDLELLRVSGIRVKNLCRVCQIRSITSKRTKLVIVGGRQGGFHVFGSFQSI